jgi:quinol-cytochrome oxidoreductase complex cytochrome b subunit
VCLGLLGLALVVLAATGLWLWFNYLPRAAQAWPTIRTDAHPGTWVRSVHRFSAYITVALALACLVLLIMWSRASPCW